MAVRLVWGLVAVAVVAIGGAGVWYVTVGEARAREREAIETAQDFSAALGRQDWPAVSARIASGDGSQAVQTLEGMHADLEIETARYRLTDLTVDGDRALVDMDVDLELAGVGALRFDTGFALERVERAWQVRWSPSIAHPELPPGGRFTRSVTWSERAPILALDGTPLVNEAGVVTVGVEPQRLSDVEQAIRALVDVAGADEAAVRELLERPGLQPDWFHPVVELSRQRFDEVDAQLRPVPGILFRAGEQRSGPPGSLGAHVIGRTGAADAELAAEIGPPYTEGQVVGISGLERGLQERLAGQPDAQVAVLDEQGEVAAVLLTVQGDEPEPVRTTFDLRIQQAAERALEGGGEPAALVVVDIATGELRASANRPIAGFDRALAGRYPPGSTFKVVSGAAYLADGLGPDSVLDCPGERTVGGRGFRNAGGLAAGPISFREAMAVSCNTAFIGAAVERSDQVVAAARAFGFASSPTERPDLPISAFGASFPEPNDSTELAAAAIGQGRVEASPAHMASVAAALAHGSWRPLRVLADDPPTEATTVPGDVAVMGQLLREVVRSGTGQAAAAPGRDVAGKTGSAEFGTGSPPPTHAWFIGYTLVGDAPEGPQAQGLAFAVLVEGGGAGGAVAAPIASRFLSALP